MVLAGKQKKEDKHCYYQLHIADKLKDSETVAKLLAGAKIETVVSADRLGRVNIKTDMSWDDLRKLFEDVAIVSIDDVKNREGR
jgi:hypothetical protein